MLQLLGNAVTIKDTVEFIWESVKNLQDSNARRELDAINVSILDEIRSIGDSVTEDALDGYIAKYWSKYKTSSSDLFPDEFRKEFANEFITANPKTKRYEEQVRRVIDISLSRIEKTLHDNLSYESFHTLRISLENTRLLQEILREFEREIRPMQEDIQEVKAGVNFLIRHWPTDAQNRDVVQPDNHSSILIGATAACAAEYEAPLMNHPKNQDICLRNLYICPNYRYEYHAPKENRSDGDLYNSIDVDNHCLCANFNRELENVICGENKQEAFRFIFIEGSPGCGKSSLAAYMSYHYQKDRENFLNGLFKNRLLIVIRMRDLNKLLREGKKLHDAILEYLKADSVEQIEKSGAVFFLDGYEELQSSVRHQVDVHQALKNLNGLGWRIIVTSRLGYIDGWNSFYGASHCVINNLNPEQKTDWLNRYERLCVQSANGLRRLIEEESKGSVSETAKITNIPLGLYMIAAKNPKEDILKEPWKIYDCVFSKAAKPFKLLCQGLAYSRFKKHHAPPDSEDPGISENDIADVLTAAGSSYTKDGLNSLIQESFALCGYCDKYEVNREDDSIIFCGSIGLYNDIIQDYFLCEQILDGLNRCYSKKASNTQTVKALKKFLCKTLQYAKLNGRVMRFARFHLVANLSNKRPDACLLSEMDFSYLPQFFENLLTNDIPFRTTNGANPISVASVILYNIYCLYKAIYDVIYSEGDEQYIRWWGKEKDKVTRVNESGVFRLLSKEILPNVQDNSDGDRYSSNLSDFQDVDLNHADLSNKNLAGADLSYAKLIHADLSGADLREAKLKSAKLCNADLRNADLRNANLKGADLQDADFLGAKLDGCNLMSASNVDYAHNISPQYLSKPFSE